MNTIELDANDFKTLFYKFKRRLFESNFMYKYGSFFDILVYAKFPYLETFSSSYLNFINELADSWVEFGGRDDIYDKTPCLILYSYYNRFLLLENHLTTIPNTISMPNTTVANQFRYLFIEYLELNHLE